MSQPTRQTSAVEVVRMHHQLDRVGDHLAGDQRGAHPRRRLRLVVRDGDGVEAERDTARGGHALADAVGERTQAQVARHRARPRRGDADDRAAEARRVDPHGTKVRSRRSRSAAPASPSRARRRTASCSRPTTRLYVGRMRLATIRRRRRAPRGCRRRRLSPARRRGRPHRAAARGRRPAAAASRRALDGVLAAPLRPGKIVAIGLNYLDHIRESNLERPERPLVFAKFPSSVIGPTDRSSSTRH